MQNTTKYAILSIAMFLGASGSVVADSPGEALAYLKELSSPSQKISSDMWEYIKALAHTQGATLAESKRKTVLQSIEAAVATTNQAKPYHDDDGYKQAVLKFLSTMHAVLNRDYAKIVSMEGISEQSYDAMEAYLVAKKKANEKLNEASLELQKEEQAFAKANKINLVTQDSEIAKKLKKAGEVLDYYNSIYLVTFKCYKQERALLDAIGKEDVSQIEQTRVTLLKVAEEGLDIVSRASPFNNDPSLINACRKNLEFYKKEASEKIPTLSAYLSKKEEYLKMKKDLDSKKELERTNAEIDQFNAKVKEMTKLSETYNTISIELNRNRTLLIKELNATADAFFNRQVPK
ncbi:MAG: hypothetical protein K8S54_06090 [Spirochaetia bacterium]|nr:hypothetical protein [Spirochaetia bacterium]